MPLIRIPAPLRSYTGGKGEVDVQGSTVGEAMDDLIAQYPSLRTHLVDRQGQLRHFVNIFIGEENVKDLQGLETPLPEGSRLLLLPTVAGGCVGVP